MKILKTERQFDEEKISYQHEISYHKYNEDLGGWVKEEMVYVIDAQEVKKGIEKAYNQKNWKKPNCSYF